MDFRQHRRPPGQGFGDLLREQEILGAREQVLSGSVPVGVDPFLDVGQENGRVLNLVENQRRGMHLVEAAGVFHGRRLDIGRFEGDRPAFLAEKVPQQRGLA